MIVRFNNIYIYLLSHRFSLYEPSHGVENT